MKYKHLQATYSMQKVITSVRNVDRGYVIIWGCFTKAKASQNSCYVQDSETSTVTCNLQTARAAGVSPQCYHNITQHYYNLNVCV
jgi:hypothetical protein